MLISESLTFHIILPSACETLLTLQGKEKDEKFENKLLKRMEC